MKRDKRIDVRVSLSELMQIKSYFKDENISDYVRNHLLDISKDCQIDTSNEADLFELFKAFLNEDSVAKDIFTRFAKETSIGGCTDTVRTNNYDEPMVWYMGKQISYSELEKLQNEYEKGGGADE